MLGNEYLNPSQLLLQSLGRRQDCLDCIRCHLLSRVRCYRAGAKVFHLIWYCEFLAPWKLTNNMVDMLTDNMENLKLHALHNWVNLAWTRRILQQFWRRRNGVLPDSHFFLFCWQLLLSCRGADEERDPERDDFRILFRIETILPFALGYSSEERKVKSSWLPRRIFAQASRGQCSLWGCGLLGVLPSTDGQGS